MFPLMLFSTLFSSTFTEPGERHWICNSSDASVWYSYCDNMRYPISIMPEPCITLKGSHGYLHIFFIPSFGFWSMWCAFTPRCLAEVIIDIVNDLIFMQTLYPYPQEASCILPDPRRDIKKLYFNVYVSFNTLEFPMRKEVLCRGSDDVYSLCRALKGETVNTSVYFSFKGLLFSKGRYRTVVEAIAGNTEEMLFCLNFTIIYHPDIN